VTRTGVSTELEQIADEIRAADRFLLTTHENPDGDALGSLLGMHHVLGQLGKDSVMFLAAKEFPLPIEYRFLPLEEVFHEAPADVVDRVLIFLDCGNIDRMPVEFLQREGAHVLNIDHHHDNTRFGSVNLVDVAASSTAEIVFDLIEPLGAELTPEIASALYVGLITDTGCFMYENTNARTHRIAAELIEAGVDVDDTYRRLYERVPREKLRLLARALEKIEIVSGGALAITCITADDYKETGAGEELTEGIIDHVRSIEGPLVAAVIRDQVAGGRAARKVSLRATDGSVDVSAIAREQGGGGHTRAAGFSTDLTYEELLGFLSARVAGAPSIVIPGGGGEAAGVEESRE
jgi:phosphoesterase RecJ-like protein